MRYLYVLEQLPNNLAASIPDLPGVGATGRDAAELERRLSQALALHLHTMRQDGDTIPRPSATPGDPELALGPGETASYVEPAPLNPVSLALREVLAESALSQAELAGRLGVSVAAVSRFLSPFYWGHSLKALRQVAEALGVELELAFKPKRAA